MFLNLPYGDLAYNLDTAKLETDEFLYDFKQFNCVTYVETVFALANIDYKQADPNVLFTAFIQNLKNIRYKNGESTLLHRNHFTSLDWIPNNQDLFKDITTELAEPNIPYTAQAKINRAEFFKKVFNLCRTGSRLHRHAGCKTLEV